jgi:diaminopimelate epimerase
MNADKSKLRELPFYKMEGCGNSFVLLTQNDPNLAWPELAKKVCDVHFGIGSDGLLVVMPSNKADFEVRMYNPDGSPMGMCGNGSRCVALYLRLTGQIPQEKNEVSILVWGRVVGCVLHGQGETVTVDLGPPILEPAKIPLIAAEPIIDQRMFPELKAQYGEFRGSVVSMGNPHCVLFTERLDQIDLAGLGKTLEHHKMFPNRANIDFVRKVCDDLLEVRVWERGAGITFACGSGACAAVVAGCLSGICAERMKVKMLGGILDVHWDRERDTVFLTGSAKVVCTGILDAAFNLV